MYANFRKEELSRAYVAVVAAAVGCKVLETRVDDDGWDLQLHRSRGFSPQVAISLKATVRADRTSDVLRYALRRSDHEHLRRPTLVPRLLVVVLLEEDLDATITHEEDVLRLTKGAYWLSLAGETSSSATASVTVHLPREQQFGPAALTEIMDALETTNALPA